MSPFSRLSVIPSLPTYTGPYQVGTQNIEIPIADLYSPTPPPNPKISTVSFRLFYPCHDQQKKRTSTVYWLPEPQGEYWRAYARFLSASPWLASLLSYIPFFRLIRYTAIPAIRDATPLQPPNKNNSGRWPIVVFSHGLGGFKNAYSQVCGSLASHGLVVVALDHRDRSAPISFIKESSQSARKAVDYKAIPHESTPEMEHGRNRQLWIRCWELGLVHDALLRINQGEKIRNTLTRDSSDSQLPAFQSLLDVDRPGKIIWAGHSFGATTMVQFLKSVFYQDASFSVPAPASQLSQQISSSSPVVLLDLWTLPLYCPSTMSLRKKPLPAYTRSIDATSQPPSPPLAILSEAFYKWSKNFLSTLEIISPPSNDPSVNESIKPYIFYPISSAHLSQSDFGVLFPWMTRKALNAEEPERTMRLNVRAILEYLRRSGIAVTDTSKLDMEIHEDAGVKVPGLGDENRLPLGQDHKILATDGSVRGWVAVDFKKELKKSTMNGYVKGSNKHEGHAVGGDATYGGVKEAQGPDEAVIQGEVMKS